MVIITYIGKMGSGKTISMVRQAHIYFLEGATIYSNIHLNFPYKPLTYELLQMYANDEKLFVNAVFIIDEAYIFFDARESMSKKNKIIAQVVLQSRKKSIKFLISTQNFLQIDVRVRNMTDYVVLCKSIFVGDNHYVNLTYQFEDDYGTTQKRLYRYHANPYYELYNTNEVVRLM